MKDINIIVIVVQVLFILGCTTNTKEQVNASTKRIPSEITNTQATNYFVNQSHDDAEEGTNGQVDLTNEDLDLGQLSGFESAKAIGIRFEGILVTKEQKIKQAFLQFTIEGNKVKAKQTELTIRAELSPNAVSFKNEAKNISSRKLTKTMVKWIPEPWNPKKAGDLMPRTPNLSPLIDEVVNQDGWQEGNALVLIITGTGERDAVSFDGGGKKEGPMLHIELN
jgi:hypothetical protein